jgi:hypothetical protein
MNFDDMTWSCHICKEERPDRFISVMKHHSYLRGIEIQQNVRYCNDRPDCIHAAQSFRFVKEPAND